MKSTLALLIATLLLSGCSVVSKEVREQAAATPPFETLVAEINAFRGQTVIVGGHLLEVTNNSDGTTLMALQAPLSSSDRPLAKDRSKGRLIITTQQFLDPEIYTKNRRITVAGKLLGSSQDEGSNAQFPYLEIEAVELHLLPETQTTPYPYYYRPRWYGYDPWYWNAPWYWGGSYWGIHGSWYMRHF